MSGQPSKALAHLSQDAALASVGPAQRVVVRGADRDRFLNGLLPTDLRALVSRQGRRTMVLDGKAKMQSDGWLLVGDQQIHLWVPDGRADAVIAFLSRYAIMDDVTFDKSPDSAGLAALFVWQAAEGYETRATAAFTAAVEPADF